METRHPARSPLAFISIIALFAVLGGILGHFSHDYGPSVDETLWGAMFGGFFGIGIAIVWSLIVKLWDN